MFIGIPSIEFKSKHPDDWLIFFSSNLRPQTIAKSKFHLTEAKCVVVIGQVRSFRGIILGSYGGLIWFAHFGPFLMGPLVVPFGGVFLGSFGAILWWAPYMEQLHAACPLLLACLLILIILELKGWACCSAAYKWQSVSDLDHHCYAGLDNHGADLSWSSTSLISVLV